MYAWTSGPITGVRMLQGIFKPKSDSALLRCPQPRDLFVGYSCMQSVEVRQLVNSAEGMIVACHS
jgi:hypothetical protein